MLLQGTKRQTHNVIILFVFVFLCMCVSDYERETEKREGEKGREGERDGGQRELTQPGGHGSNAARSGAPFLNSDCVLESRGR